MPSGTEFEKFVDLVGRSQLVDPARLEPFVEQLRQRAMDGPREEVAAELVDAGLLTRWQAENLLKGKHKGFILGSYRLLDQLGRGGMSTVYLAEHMLMRRRAAIKVLPRQRVNDRSYLGRFHREAQATASLDHPNIVRVYDIASDGKTHFIAMEFVDGKDLQTLVAEHGPLDYRQAADYMAQSAVGLQYAHDEGLIHRDVKPANLLAGKDGIVKVLDLGLAKFDDDSLPSLTLAHEDNVLGTVDYLAPEQAVDSHRVDYRADLYSLGCTFYFVLTGHPPFPKGTLAQRVVKHQREEPVSIRSERPDVPAELEELCRRMMAKDVNQRVQSALEIADELVAWMRRQGVRSPAEGPLQVLRRRARGTPADDPVEKTGDRLNSTHHPRGSARVQLAPPTTPAARTYRRHAEEDDELQLVVDDSGTHLTSGPVSNGPLHPAAQPTGDEEDLEERVSILEQELVPIESSSHDSLLSGERIRVERRLQPIDAAKAGSGIPPWAWWLGAAAVLLVVVVLVVVTRS